MGDAVRWGSSNKVESWDQCCEQCLNFVPEAGSNKVCNGARLNIDQHCMDSRHGACISTVCTAGHAESSTSKLLHKIARLAVWDWCGDKAGCGKQYQECWLKYLVRHCRPIPWPFSGCAAAVHGGRSNEPLCASPCCRITKSLPHKPVVSLSIQKQADWTCSVAENALRKQSELSAAFYYYYGSRVSWWPSAGAPGGGGAAHGAQCALDGGRHE